MTTHVVAARFTAAEALQFFDEYIAASVPEEVLQTPLANKPPVYLADVQDYWAGLPREFVRQWGHYRRPPVSMPARLLRWLCGFNVGWKMVYNIRRALRI